MAVGTAAAAPMGGGFGGRFGGIEDDEEAFRARYAEAREAMSGPRWFETYSVSTPWRSRREWVVGVRAHLQMRVIDWAEAEATRILMPGPWRAILEDYFREVILPAFNPLRVNITTPLGAEEPEFQLLIVDGSGEGRRAVVDEDCAFTRYRCAMVPFKRSGIDLWVKELELYPHEVEARYMADPEWLAHETGIDPNSARDFE